MRHYLKKPSITNKLCYIHILERTVHREALHFMITIAIFDSIKRVFREAHHIQH